MEQYIDKNRVEEILRNLWKKDDGYNAEHRICYNKALQEVQCELDTLEVKEVDLNNGIQLTWEDIRELYIIFAEVDVEIELCKSDNIKSETIGYYLEVLKRFKTRKGE